MMKTSKGMTHAITVSTLTKWIYALPRCVPVCDALEQFTGMHTATSEQHKYLRPNTLSWENRNHGIFVQWLKAHPPFFGYEPDNLVSLSTGIGADKSANCDNAVEMQYKLMVKCYRTSSYTEITKWRLLVNSVRPSKSGNSSQSKCVIQRHHKCSE